MVKELDYTAIHYKPQFRLVLAITPILAVVHLAWCFCVDRLVWNYFGAHGDFNPFGVNLLVYLPACTVLKLRLDDHIGGKFWLGTFILLVTAILAGGVSSYCLVAEISNPAKRFGRLRWRLCVLLFLWLGWVDVFPSQSFTQQYYHWSTVWKLKGLK